GGKAGDTLERAVRDLEPRVDLGKQLALDVDRRKDLIADDDLVAGHQRLTAGGGCDVGIPGAQALGADLEGVPKMRQVDFLGTCDISISTCLEQGTVLAVPGRHAIRQTVE